MFELERKGIRSQFKKLEKLIIRQFIDNLRAHLEEVHGRVRRAPIEIVVVCFKRATRKIEQVVGVLVTPPR